MPTRIRSFFCLFLIAASCQGWRACGQELPHPGETAREPFADVPLYDTPHSATASAAKDGAGNQATKKREQTDHWNLAAGDAAEPGSENDILLVNNLGDPQALVLSGVSLFPERPLRLALSCDLKHQAAARPSNATGDYLSTLEARLREGYLHGGCPDAKVSAHRAGERQAIVVNVEEGAQFRKGQIHLIDSKTIDEQAFVKLLTTPRSPRPWTYLFAKQPPTAPSNEKQAQNKNDEKNASAKADEDPLTFWKSGDAFDFRETALADIESKIRQAPGRPRLRKLPFSRRATTRPIARSSEFADLRAERCAAHCNRQC